MSQDMLRGTARRFVTIIFEFLRFLYIILILIGHLVILGYFKVKNVNIIIRTVYRYVRTDF